MSETKASGEPINSVPEVKKENSVIPKQEDEIPLPTLNMKIRKEELDPMELITQRAIAIQLKSLGIEFTNSALEDLFDLLSTYINGLLQSLQNITQTQRRFKASPKDLKLLLRGFGISTGELEKELERSKKDNDELTQRKKELETLAAKTKGSGKVVEEVDPQDPSFVFFAADHDLTKLIPPQHQRSRVIPVWLPEFPPDHTYRKTPKYLERIKDQKIVRQKVVEESKFGEQALENLIKYAQNVDDFDEEMNDGEGEVIDGNGNDKKDFKEESEVNGQKVDIWSNNEKKIDIEAYVIARLNYYKAKEEKKKQKLENIDREYYLIIEQLSAFSSDTHSDETVSPDLYLEREFKKTFNSLKSLKKKKAKRQIERKRLQQEEDKRRDEAKAKAPVDFNDFDNFDTFENFENFDSVNSTNDNENVMSFEGVDNDKSSKVPATTEPALPSFESIGQDSDESTSEPTTQQSANVPASDTYPIGESTNINSDLLNTISEPSTSAPEKVIDNETKDDENEDEDEDEDDDEDEDRFDDVPLA